MAKVGSESLPHTRVGSAVEKVKTRLKPQPREELESFSTGRALVTRINAVAEAEKDKIADKETDRLIEKPTTGTGWELSEGFGEHVAQRIYGELTRRNLKDLDYPAAAAELTRLRQEIASLKEHVLNIKSEREAFELNTIIADLESTDVEFLSQQLAKEGKTVGQTTVDKVKQGLLFTGYEQILDRVEEIHLSRHLLHLKDTEGVNLGDENARWWLFKKLAQIAQAETDDGLFPTAYDAFEDKIAKLGNEAQRTDSVLWGEFLKSTLENEFVRFYGERKLTQFELESPNTAFSNLQTVLSRSENFPFVLTSYNLAGSVTKNRREIIFQAKQQLEQKGEFEFYNDSELLEALRMAEYHFIPQGEQPETGESRLAETDFAKKGENLSSYIARLYGADDPDRRKSIVAETIHNLLGSRDLIEIAPDLVEHTLTELEPESGGKVYNWLKKAIRSKWTVRGLNAVRIANSIFPSILPLTATAHAVGEISPNDFSQDLHLLTDFLSHVPHVDVGHVLHEMQEAFTPAVAHAAGLETGDPEGAFITHTFEQAENHPPSEHVGIAQESIHTGSPIIQKLRDKYARQHPQAPIPLATREFREKSQISTEGQPPEKGPEPPTHVAATDEHKPHETDKPSASPNAGVSKEQLEKYEEALEKGRKLTGQIARGEAEIPPASVSPETEHKVAENESVEPKPATHAEKPFTLDPEKQIIRLNLSSLPEHLQNALKADGRTVTEKDGSIIVGYQAGANICASSQFFTMIESLKGNYEIEGGFKWYIHQFGVTPEATSDENLLEIFHNSATHFGLKDVSYANTADYDLSRFMNTTTDPKEFVDFIKTEEGSGRIAITVFDGYKNDGTPQYHLGMIMGVETDDNGNNYLLMTDSNAMSTQFFSDTWGNTADNPAIGILRFKLTPDFFGRLLDHRAFGLKK